MNIKGVKDFFKKYIIFTTLVSIGFIVFLLGNTDEKQIEVQKNNIQEEVNRCLDIPEDLVTDIESGLTINGGGKLINVKGVKSNDFEERYFISGFLQGEGISENEIATFTVSSLEKGKTMIGSVNAFAKEFAEWPTPRIIDSTNDGIKQSQECLKN